MRIIVANEPRAYREAIATAFSCVRPDADIVVLESYELDGAVARHAPDFVICSRLTEVVETRSVGWALLYPDGRSRVVTCVDGRRRETPDLDFNGLLLLIEEAWCLGREK